VVQIPLLFVILGWVVTVAGFIGLTIRIVRRVTRYTQTWAEALDQSRQEETVKARDRILSELRQLRKEIRESNGNGEG